MNDIKLAETVLTQLECFYVLQELDEAFRKRTPSARQFTSKIYSNRPVNYVEIYPLVRRATTLTLLALPIAYICKLSDRSLHELEFEIKPCYDLTCYRDGNICDLKAKEVLIVLRNAVAHMSDFASNSSVQPNISFDGEATRFWTQTKSTEIVISSEAGFLAFIRDLFSTCRKAAGMLLKDC